MPRRPFAAKPLMIPLGKLSKIGRNNSPTEFGEISMLTTERFKINMQLRPRLISKTSTLFLQELTMAERVDQVGKLRHKLTRDRNGHDFL